MYSFRNSRNAFTLIELLIVVAIIGILAAIAVPNFLTAQLRAQIARVKADFKTISTGFSTYQLDNNNYPEDNWGPCYDYNAYKRLTTPVSYITSIEVFKDYFTNENIVGAVGADCRWNYYDYGKQDYITQAGVGYVVISFGPDLTLNMPWDASAMTAMKSGQPERLTFLYDPTNGSRSSGDFILTGIGIMNK